MEKNWGCRQEWAVCFRDNASMRGIDTNNYAESGIRILKDIVAIQKGKGIQLDPTF